MRSRPGGTGGKAAPRLARPCPTNSGTRLAGMGHAYRRPSSPAGSRSSTQRPRCCTRPTPR
eukprot:1390029-Lingulodinium_polyedra.AAC.1